MTTAVPAMSDVTVLVTRGDAAVCVRHWDGERWHEDAPAHGDAARALATLAEAHDGWIAWHDERIAPRLSDVTNWPLRLRHRLEVLHAGTIDRPDRAAESLGYVDFDSLYFFHPDTNRPAPMWFVSGLAGVAHAHLLRAVGLDTRYGCFAAALIDFGARGMRLGMCPWADPALLDATASGTEGWQTRLTPSQLAVLVRRLYGRKWALFWLVNCVLFEHRMPVGSVLRALVARGPIVANDSLVRGLEPALHTPAPGQQVDVVIPTLGRPDGVRHLLQDLAAQTHRPGVVAVVEQQPDGAPSALDSLTREVWPFTLVHRCETWTGACKARNVGIRLTGGHWTLFLDDDVRLSLSFVAYVLSVAEAYGADVVTALVHSPGRPQAAGDVARPHFTSVLPGCATLVSRSAVDDVGPFDLALEGGWGEDFEFGVRLRQGQRLMLRAPGEPVLHLHASTGGFRGPIRRPWEAGAVLPKPSPTILLSRRGLPRVMQRAYRTFYLLKRLVNVPWYRMPLEVVRAARQWRVSEAWALRLRAERATK